MLRIKICFRIDNVTLIIIAISSIHMVIKYFSTIDYFDLKCLLIKKYCIAEANSGVGRDDSGVQSTN